MISLTKETNYKTKTNNSKLYKNKNKNIKAEPRSFDVLVGLPSDFDDHLILVTTNYIQLGTMC